MLESTTKQLRVRNLVARPFKILVFEEFQVAML